MKGKIKLGFFVVILLGLLSCGGPEEEIDGNKEYISTYICPMYCDGSGSSEKGTCPVCETKYMENDLYGHAEEAGYDDYDNY